MVKILIAAGASVALVTAAAAADMPHPQPVYQPAPVGKAPIGKGPVGNPYGPPAGGPYGPPVRRY